MSEMTGLALPHVGKYLQVLCFLGLVRREVSLDVEDPGHTRTTRYEIADPYLRFHFISASRKFVAGAEPDRSLDGYYSQPV